MVRFAQFRDGSELRSVRFSQSGGLNRTEPDRGNTSPTPPSRGADDDTSTLFVPWSRLLGPFGKVQICTEY